MYADKHEHVVFTRVYTNTMVLPGPCPQYKDNSVITTTCFNCSQCNPHPSQFEYIF